jgi:hypothetical protein
MLSQFPSRLSLETDPPHLLPARHGGRRIADRFDEYGIHRL